jgi:hypothetical protein
VDGWLIVLDPAGTGRFTVAADSGQVDRLG